MKKNFICKCLFTLGLFLFLTLLLPFSSYNTAVAQAASTSPEKEKNEYRLIFKSITLVKGKSFALKVFNLSDNAKTSFKSDDQEIASVDEKGVISANKVGNTVITVSVKDGSGVTNLTCDVTVGPPAISVKWTQSRIIMGVDDVDILKVILKPSNTAEDAKFQSNDNSIVDITTGARITAVSKGMTYVFAIIDATTSDGTSKNAKCQVIVTSKENVPLLENYFQDHPELDLIPEADLSDALMNFFNGENKDSSSSNIVSSLNKYLDKTFDLGAYRKQWEEREAARTKITLNSLEVVTESSTIL